MKRQNETTSVNYNAEKVTENISLQFRKDVKGGVTNVSGSIQKDGSEVGTVYVHGTSNGYTIQLKPLDSYTAEERKAVIAAISDCVEEILSE
jgi:nicotinamide mononucleotide (NMN) deamidase PncC